MATSNPRSEIVESESHIFKGDRRRILRSLSRIAPAIGLVASSFSLWSGSASAAPVPVANASCVDLLGDGTYWYLTGFDGPSVSPPREYSTTVDVDTANRKVTFVGTVATNVVDKYSPRIEFSPVGGPCPGGGVLEGIPPQGIEEVCVVTSPGAVKDFVVKLRKRAAGSWVVPDPGYDNVETPGVVVNFDDVMIIPSRIEAEDFVADPAFTGSTIEVRIVLGADLPCTFSTPDNDEPAGGFDFDIDIDHYRNRAASEVGALPDTL